MTDPTPHSRRRAAFIRSLPEFGACAPESQPESRALYQRVCEACVEAGFAPPSRQAVYSIRRQMRRSSLDVTRTGE